VSFRSRISKPDLTDPNLRLIAVALVGALFLLAGLLTAGDGKPAELPADRSETSRFVRGTVDSIAGDRLVLATDAGPVSATLTSDTVYESLKTAPLASVQAGETVNVGSVPHSQTLLVVVGVVVIPPALVEAQR
jgi:hypothetical protein